MQLKSCEQNKAYPAATINSILQDFFDKHGLEGAQKDLWNLLTGYLAQRIEDVPVAISQSDTAYFCANISSLLYQLHALYIAEK
jgi:hypothetical protein